MSETSQEAISVVIRWKPYMWWAYFKGNDFSHSHGESPEQLIASIRAVWPNAVITVDPMTDADRLTLYETALRTIQEAAAGYIHPERRVTAEQLIDVVLAEVDNRDLVKAMRKANAP